MKIRILIVSLMAALLFVPAEMAVAVIAWPHPVNIAQRDGTRILVTLQGDEKLKWAVTPDGYTLVYNSEGIFEYGKLDSSGELVPSGIKARNPDSRTPAERNFLAGIPTNLFYSPNQLSILRQILKSATTDGPERVFPPTGSGKLVCLLIGFTDVPFTKTGTDFQNLFNQVGYTLNGATGSVKDFFAESSYGQLDLTVDVFGPFAADNTQAYYGGNNILGDDRRPRELVTEAVQKADPTVNFAEYDNDGDGSVDGVYVIYAGYGEEAGGGADCIWAHAWNISTIMCDGKSVSRYSCSPELRGSSGTSITHIGVICHEFGHVLGAPDFYDTNYATGGQYSGTGYWDLQASGSWNNNGATPAQPNPYTKIYIYNWAGVTELTAGASVTLQDAGRYATSFYQFSTATAGEFYLLENRQNIGFDSHIPGHGMLIYHVHSDIGSSSINTTYPQKMYPVCASATTEPGNTPASYGTINGDGCPFPGSSSKTSFTDGTIPSQKSWAGVPSGMPIGEISENNTAKTISFRILGTTATLSDLRSAGTRVSGFSSSVLNYYITLPAGTSVVPTVTATTTDVHATKLITPAASLPGTTTVKVTAEDAATEKTYSITYSVIPGTPGAISGVTTQCPEVTGQTYSISAVPGASTYNWTVPNGWSITAGSGSVSITVRTGQTGQNGNITVTASNSGGTSAASTLAVTVNPGAPAQPDAISGSVLQCPSATGQVYSVSPVTNATNYAWTVPTGWSITGGAGTVSITVSAGTAGQNGNVSVKAGNSCGLSTERTLAVSVAGALNEPGAITGIAEQCPGLESQVYSIIPVVNASTYNWSVPTGWTITGGTGTPSITVRTGSSGQNGVISVTAGNACGTSSASNLSVSVKPGIPAKPGTITGVTRHCPALAGQTYSISAVSNATQYDWMVPAGWTITGGAGTTSIEVTVGAFGQDGTISVSAGNDCGKSLANVLEVTVAPGTPQKPGAIAGVVTQCPSLAGQIYSVAAVSNATEYTWTVPAGWMITDGAGTRSITVTVGSTGADGFITVTAGNDCGTSTASSLQVTVSSGAPPTPGAITGQTIQCPGITSQVYSINAVAGATSYLWELPGGWVLSGGAGTRTINVTTGSAGQNGNISVTAINDCGSSSASTLSVQVNPGEPAQPGSITGVVTQCPLKTNQTYSISEVPNATTYTWTLPTGWTISGGQGTSSIIVTTGTGGQNGSISVTAANSCGTSSPRSIGVTINAVPATPGPITGSVAQCPGVSGQIYSITSVSMATSYSWTVPVGWTITGGDGSSSIVVTTGSYGQNGSISVIANNSCGSSSSSSIAVTTMPGAPVQPGVISGSSVICPNLANQTYSIESVPNATTYVWSIPSGWTLTGGAGTTAIQVTTGAAGQRGNISVTANNSCGTSETRTLAVEVTSIPDRPGIISGTSDQCPNQADQIYSIGSVQGATLYNWTVPTGWTINSGAGTTSIRVTTGATGQNGNISVVAQNNCGSSISRSLSVSVNPGVPDPPGVINGSAVQCPAQVDQVYSVAPVANASGYTWTIPTGWYISGGQGTTTIFVTTGSAGQGGEISVNAGNSCGASASATLAVTVDPGIPLQPGAITGLVSQFPQLGNQVYSIAPVANASDYIWTVPDGWVITGGAGTNSILVTTGIAGQNGIISVRALNSCGSSPSSWIDVTVRPALSDDAKLKNLTINGITITGFNPNTTDYAIQVPYETTVPPEVDGITNHLNASMNISQATTIPGVATIDVTAENGVAKQTYRVSITREPNSDASLLMILVDGNEIADFNPAMYEYNIDLSCHYSGFPTLAVVKSDSNASVTLNGITQYPGTVTILVVAEDGITQKTYNVTFTWKECSSDASLRDLLASGVTIPGFDPSVLNYEVVLNPAISTAPVISALANYNGAQMVITQASGLPGTATVVVTATDDLTQRTYTVYFRNKSSEARLSAILIDDVGVTGFNPDIYSYQLPGLPDRTTKPQIFCRTEDANARILILTEETKNPDGYYRQVEATITVTAEDGVTQKVYVARLTFVLTGIGEAPLANEVQVFPNPSTGNFSILYRTSEPSLAASEIRILDALGRVVYLDHLYSTDRVSVLPVLLEDCQPGVYVLLVRSGNNQQVARLVVE